MKVAIKSIRVVGCGPIDDLELDFTDTSGAPRPMTLLGGANGSGKTTVLEVIAALFELLDLSENKQPILSRTKFAQLNLLIDSVDFAVFCGERPPDVILPASWYGEVYNEAHPKQSFATDGNVLGHLQSAISGQQGLAQPHLRMSFEAPWIAPDFTFPPLIYVPHLRGLFPVAGKNIESENTQFECVQRISLSHEYKGSLNSYLVWIEYAEPSVFGDITRAIGSIYPDHKTIEIDRKRLTAVIISPNDVRHDIDLLSSGEQNLLIMLIELRRRLLPSSIVLIDEIENSLHPAFQHRLGLALKRLQKEIDFQLIATSHSHTFLDILGAENTLILPNRRQHDRTSTTAAA